ncbi:MAG: hypothetical protein WKH64_01620 [Chloroflexia bacterium]
MDSKHQSQPADMISPTSRVGMDRDVWESWRRASHYVFYGLLVLSATLTLPDPSLSWASKATAVGLAALLGGWYRFNILRRPDWIQERPQKGLSYFAVTGMLYLALIQLHPSFMFLAFSLYWQV